MPLEESLHGSPPASQETSLNLTLACLESLNGEGGPPLPRGNNCLLPPTPSITELPDWLADFIISFSAQISLPSPSTSAEQWPSHQQVSDWRGEAGL